METLKIPTLSLPPGGVASATDISGSSGFGVGGHIPEVQSLIVSPGYRCLPHGLERHHQTIYVCQDLRIVMLLFVVVVL